MFAGQSALLSERYRFKGVISPKRRELEHEYFTCYASKLKLTVFSHDVIPPINNKTVAILVYQINPVGVELFRMATHYFVPIKFHGYWPHKLEHYVIIICFTYCFT